ncbi:hypothetical protein TVAG_175610 [Trichomonas vaginalis G3]|uniref:Surface antigen BspA-like n=1 Tax=Trichomonas vaginalis (strain ATCC PRA-98 / G3) TaxID=412133 RepID=A2F5M9_TRIV3|nr:leucine-rich repeats (6 copies)-containing protein [Trichomonas vaginalis G3]EAX99792.1 hypothetical protein TVAG_175610 [Trichomonas vaginalis G3]KAI5494426.1 leucine-rich repeats (6 copies)-containing protein [Trichomonas vaginalis G3]|eukprot:XP_001312722.1 hypothetical protein [Trichomonas vaginalis G3]
MNTFIQEIELKPGLLSQRMLAKCKNLKKVTIIDTDPDDVRLKTIPTKFLHESSVSEIILPDKFNRIEPLAFAFTNIKTFELKKQMKFISSTAFSGIDDIQLLIGDNKNFKILEHEVLDINTKQLVFTFGKLPSVYILPREVRSIAANSIISHPVYDENNGSIIDYGVTTLVVPGTVDAEQDSLANLPYLTNLCYGGSLAPRYLISPTVDRIFVTNNFIRRNWLTADGGARYNITRGPCNTSLPFEEFINDMYKPIIIPVEPPEDDNETESSVTNNTLDTTTSSTKELITIDEPNKKTTTPLLITLVILAALEVLAITGIILYIVLKRDDDSDDSVIEMNAETITAVTDLDVSVTVDNPLFTHEMMDDDPFAKDFEEKDKTENFFDTGIVDAEN